MSWPNCTQFTSQKGTRHDHLEPPRYVFQLVEATSTAAARGPRIFHANNLDANVWIDCTHCAGRVSPIAT